MHTEEAGEGCGVSGCLTISRIPSASVPRLDEQKETCVCIQVRRSYTLDLPCVSPGYPTNSFISLTSFHPVPSLSLFPLHPSTRSPHFLYFPYILPPGPLTSCRCD